MNIIYYKFVPVFQGTTIIRCKAKMKKKRPGCSNTLGGDRVFPRRNEPVQKDSNLFLFWLFPFLTCYLSFVYFISTFSTENAEAFNMQMSSITSQDSDNKNINEE